MVEVTINIGHFYSEMVSEKWYLLSFCPQTAPRHRNTDNFLFPWLSRSLFGCSLDGNQIRWDRRGRWQSLLSPISIQKQIADFEQSAPCPNSSRKSRTSKATSSSANERIETPLKVPMLESSGGASFSSAFWLARASSRCGG